MTRSLTRLFVYGTLRQGERSHALLRRARFVGGARTPPVYELIDLGEYPALVANGATTVMGELYLVDAATLAVLDEWEEHPGYYRRGEIALAAGERAESYLLPAREAAGKPRIASGDWRRR